MRRLAARRRKAGASRRRASNQDGRGKPGKRAGPRRNDAAEGWDDRRSGEEHQTSRPGVRWFGRLPAGQTAACDVYQGKVNMSAAESRLAFREWRSSSRRTLTPPARTGAAPVAGLWNGDVARRVAEPSPLRAHQQPSSP